MAAAVVSAFVAFSLVSRGPGGLFNDFYDYWGASRLLATGGNPYDTASLSTLLASFGVQFQVGTGYSYPLLFAILMLPLAAMPPQAAAVVFTALGLAAFALAVAMLLTPMSRLRLRELVLLAALMGAFTAVRGSIYFGQANLLVLPLLVLAGRGLARPLTLAVATAVKLYPAAGMVALAAQGRRAVRATATAVAAAVVLIAVPNLIVGGGGGDRIAGFLAPDPFWTNQSVNGWVSRLALPSDSTLPPLPGLPVTPTMLLVVAAIGLLATAVVVIRRGEPWLGCLALMLGWGVVAAPKNSLWNYAPLLIMFAYCWPRVRLRWPLLLTLLAGYGLIQLQSQLDIFRETFYSGNPALTWLSSLALYGALLVGGLTAYLVLREPPVSPLSEA